MKVCLACGARHHDRAFRCPQCGVMPPSRGGFLSFVSDPADMASLPHDARYLLPELTAAESWHFWFQARRRLIIWAIQRHFANPSCLLDVGCGTGFVLEGILRAWPMLAASGCDAQLEPLTIAKRRLGDVALFHAEADSLPFEREFDVVVALDVVEHIDRDDAALAGMLRALRPGGGLVLTVPQHPWLWSAVDDFSHHRRRYTRASLHAVVRGAGFDLVHSTSCFMLTLPMTVMSRWRHQSADQFDPAGELRIPRSVNYGLRKLVAIEGLLLRTGLSLPAGSSRLLLARRPLD